MAYFADEDNLKQLAEMKSLGVAPVATDLSHAPLKGQSFVVTGTLASMGREEAEEKLRALGATVTGSVGKSTTALICGEKPGKSKTDKAAQLGTKIIFESDFLTLLQKP